VKTILLLGAGLGSPDAVTRLKSLGICIILVELRHLFDSKKCEAADEILLTDYRKDGFSELAAKLREIWRFDVVVSLTEGGVAVAARLNKMLGLPGADERAIGYLNDKARMRALLHQRHFSELPYRLLSSRADLASFIGSTKFPLILKPVDGGGSFGIHRVNSAEEAEKAFEHLTAQRITILAEQYVDGKEYSVESFSIDGRHTVVAITEKMVNERFVEVGHVVPAMLDASTAADVKRFVTEFLDIVGVLSGPCHTEIKLGSNGMKIIESHNRCGGGNITKLVLLVYGVDLVKLTGQLAIGAIDTVQFDPEPQGAAAISFFIFPSGEIVELDGLQHLEANPSTVEYRCNYRKGDTVPPLVDNGGRSGYVIVHEDSAQNAIEKARHLARGVIVRSAAS
jgi:biotin carboxylase